MNSITKVLSATALSALMATAALAETPVMPDPQAALTAIKGGTIDVGGVAGQEVTATSEAFVGTPVLSADAKLIGTVEKAASTADGTLLLVMIDPALGFEAERFTVTLAASETSDGQVELGYSSAELRSALNVQLEDSNTNG